MTYNHFVLAGEPYGNGGFLFHYAGDNPTSIAGATRRGCCRREDGLRPPQLHHLLDHLLDAQRARGINADGSWNAGFSQILDGAAVMTGNPQHARHTPTVTLTFGESEHSNSGKSVCADCYLYLNANVPFVMLVGVRYKLAAESVVVCSETGKFYDARPGKECDQFR